MTTSYEIQQRIAELNKQKMLAEAAEQDRIDRETANQRAIVDAQQELVQLQQQEARARIDEAVRANSAFITEQNLPAANRLLSALTDFEAGKISFTAVVEAARALDATFNHARGLASAGANAAYQIASYVYVDDPLTSVSTNAQQSTYSAGQYLERFTGALYTALVLALYISQARDEMDSRRRNGFAFALVGFMVGTAPNITMQSLQEQSRREWLASLRRY